jgi:hypothetical protein
MTRDATLKHEFVEFIPDELHQGVLYLSLEFGTAVHKCCCGCGNEVVTPLSPTDWRVTFDGISISLYPSIGNWSMPCRSHYWIEHSKVLWAAQWSQAKINAGRMFDRYAKDRYYGDEGAPNKAGSKTEEAHRKPKTNLWSKLKRRWM